jgi:putative ABC transport system permease protein
MKAIWLKIKADITSRPLLSALILITVISSAALLTLALATLMNISAPYDQAFKELNGAHVWLYLDRSKVNSRDIERIEALPGVVESTGLMYNSSSRVQIGDNQVWVSLRAIPLKMPAVNRLLVREGRYLVPGKNELLASTDLDDLYKLDVGDTIRVTRADGKEVDLPVIGLAYNPMWDVYRTSQPPYIYVSEDTLRDLFPDDSTWGWSVGLKLADPQAVDELVASVKETIHPDAITSYSDWRDVRESAIFEVQLNFVFLGAFGLFAILATVLVVASSIGSIVLSQFRQIGILKAVGFTQSQIVWLYVGQYLALSLVGCTLGLLLGLALSPLPLQSAAVSMSTTFRPPLNAPLVALVFATVSGVVILATLGAAYRGARANIIRSIAVGAEPPRKKLPWGTRLAAHLGLPMAMILGVSDVFAKPFRSFMTGLNLTLGVIGIVFALALNETLDTYRTDPSLLGVAYDAAVTRESTSDHKARHLLSKAPGVEAFYAEYLAEVETPAGQSFNVRAVEGDLESFPFRIDEGRLLRPNTNEAIAGRGLLDWLGLGIGDEITVTFKDQENRPVTWKIVGQYPEPSNAGQMLMVNLSTVTRVVKQAEPDTYFLKLAPDLDTEQLKRYIKPRQDTDLDITFVAQAIPDEVIYVQLAIFALSVILIGIALINVFNTSLLAMREKVRTVGILKTVGMTPAQVIAMANTTAGYLGFLAAVLGIPIGLVFTQALLNILSTSYGFSHIRATLSVLYILPLIPLIVLVSVAGSAIPGRWAAKVSIVQVLRSE